MLGKEERARKKGLLSILGPRGRQSSSSSPSLVPSVYVTALCALSLASSVSAEVGNATLAAGNTTLPIATERTVIMNTHTVSPRNDEFDVDGIIPGVAGVALLCAAMAFASCFAYYITGHYLEICRMRLAGPANNDQEGNNHQQEIPNGHALVGQRDPDDNQGEIMEIHEARREDVQEEAIPMVAMGVVWATPPIKRWQREKEKMLYDGTNVIRWKKSSKYVFYYGYT